MADELQWAHFYEHPGGLNTRYTATTTPPFDATELENVENVALNGFRKISGYTRFVECPLLASGTKAGGTLDLDAESDPWTGAGDATTFSTSAGIGTFDESAGATATQRYFNAEAGLVTTADAAYEIRVKIRSGGTLSGVYANSICVLDNATKRFELVALETGGVKQIGVLTTTADRTVIASYASASRVTHDWTAYTRYRVSWDGGGNITVFTDDLTTAVITIAETSLPASTETSRVAVGSFETATVIIWDFDYIVYKIASTSLDTAPITGIYAFVDEANTQAVIATSGTALYRFDSSTADWIAITGGTAFTSGAKPHFVTFNEASANNPAIVIITTESRNTPQKWDGTTRANLGGTPPSGRYCAVYNERLWIANTSGEPSAVFFSALADPEDRDDQAGTWDTTNDIFLIDRHKFGEITGIVTINQRLLIFSMKGIHYIQGWGKGSFLVEEVSHINGCIAPNSIIIGPWGDERREGVFFRDRDGYYWTDGQVGNIIRVSEKILTTIRTDFNASQVTNELAFLDKRRSLVGWGTTQDTDTTNSLVYALEYVEGSRRQQDGRFQEGWFPFSIPMRAAGNVISSSVEVTLFSDHTGLAFILDNGNNVDSADIDGFRTSAWQTFGGFHINKLVRYMIVYTKTVGDWDLEVSWGINYADTFTNMFDVNLAGPSDLLGSTFILGTSILGTAGVTFKKIPIDVSCNAIRFKFSNANADEPFTVLGFSVGFEVAEDWFESNI